MWCDGDCLALNCRYNAIKGAFTAPLQPLRLPLPTYLSVKCHVAVISIVPLVVTVVFVVFVVVSVVVFVCVVVSVVVSVVVFPFQLMSMRRSLVFSPQANARLVGSINFRSLAPSSKVHA